jgi:protein-S-isoprenylcysteine O-methyltransferase Ste14
VLVLVVVLWPTPGGLTVVRGVAALALVAAGEWCRMRAVGVAGKCTRTRGSNVRELVTSGPFAHVRNPLYIGNFVLTYGLVVLSKVDWLLWAFPLAFFFQYAAIVAWEERVLAESFGQEYERYREEVPAWVPSPRAYSSPSGHAFRREIALRSERDSLRAVSVLAAVILLKHFVFHGAISSLFAR